MPQGRERTLQDIQSFISKKRPRCLREKLLRDLHKLRIVREADVECATYHHLRRYIGEDPKWRVFARKHVPKTGYFVDLLIFKNDFPAVAIELKWGELNIGKKDRKSLYEAITKLKVQKAYWLSVNLHKQKPGGIRKRFKERNVLHRIIVQADFTDEELADYRKRREQYKSEMPVGRGHK